MAGRKHGETAKVLYATLVGSMDTNAIIPIISFYSVALGADLLMVGLIVGAYSIAHVPANLVFGRVVDRIGRRRPLVYGLLWDAVSVALYAIATTPIGLLVVRLSHGLGGGFVGPASMSLVAGHAPPGRMGRSLALYGISIAIAVILGFGVAGVAASRGAYQPLFFGLAFALWTGAIVAARVHEPITAVAKRPPLNRAAFLAFLRSAYPFAGYASIFALYFLLGALVTIAPYFEGPPVELTDARFAIALLVFAVVSIVVHYPSGAIADRFGPAIPCGLGLGAIGAAVALLPFSPSYTALIGLMALFGLGHGLVFPSSSALISKFAHADFLGLATGTFYAILVAGVAIGAPLTGAIANATSGAMALWTAALVAGATFLVVLVAVSSARQRLRSAG